MKLQFIHPSELELKETYNYYEDQLAGLGDNFLDEFNNTVKIILKYPTLWLKVGKRTRRAIINRFPYFILYIQEANTIYITCIAHQHRSPEYYVERLK